jgi:LuxR family maltose regulon positive regulatory protein
LALRGSGDLTQALVVLEESLVLAEAERFIRVFLDNGQPMRLLLTEWLTHADYGPLRGYADHLLSQFEAESNRCGVAQTENSPADDSLAGSEQALVEPLSPRELEVLHLMALGLTNKKIAEQLVVAPGTIKAHAASIYRKLDVANRTEAVARARELDILP